MALVVLSFRFQYHLRSIFRTNAFLAFEPTALPLTLRFYLYRVFLSVISVASLDFTRENNSVCTWRFTRSHETFTITRARSPAIRLLCIESDLGHSSFLTNGTGLLNISKSTRDRQRHDFSNDTKITNLFIVRVWESVETWKLVYKNYFIPLRFR